VEDVILTMLEVCFFGQAIGGLVGALIIALGQRSRGGPSTN
jgi:hypothetical protein